MSYGFFYFYTTSFTVVSLHYSDACKREQEGLMKLIRHKSRLYHYPLFEIVLGLQVQIIHYFEIVLYHYPLSVSLVGGRSFLACDIHYHG